MKLNVGDKVRVKKYLVGGSEYGEVYFAHAMEDFLGQEAKIVRVFQDNIYNISIDDEGFFWTSDMLDKVDESNDKKILFAKMRDGAIIPSKREEDGAFDVYACFDEDYLVIQPHETKMIPTGICSAFSSDYVAILKERGSTGTKGMGQRAGVVDSGYRGEWFSPITNHNDIPIVIAKAHIKESDYCEALTGDKELSKAHIVYPYTKAITQVVMVEVPKLSIKEVTVDEIKAIPSERGESCLGASGK